MKDITTQIRGHDSYVPSTKNEFNESHEFPHGGDGGNSLNSSNSFGTFGGDSCNSCISSTPDERPRLSEDALYGPLGDIVRLYEGETEADGAAILVQLLVGVGNLIGPGPYFLADGARHHVNLYAVICGRTSKSRKGTSWVRVRNVLSELDPGWVANRIKSGLVSGEGGAQVFDQEGDEKRLLLVESEFGQILLVMKRDGNTVSIFLRQAWDGSRIAVLRRKEPIEIDESHVSLIGHITLPELQKLLTSVDISNGTANRILWVYAERAMLLPEGGHEPDFSPILEPLREIIEIARSRGRIELDETARAEWAGIYNALSIEPPGKLGELLSRAEPQVMRLALLDALLDNTDAIQVVHLRAALALWHYCEASTAFIFAESLISPMARRIWDGLADGPLTMTQVHGIFKKNASKSAIDAALRELQGRIEERPAGTGNGRTIARRE